MFASHKDNADNIGIQIAKDVRYISKVKNKFSSSKYFKC